MRSRGPYLEVGEVVRVAPLDVVEDSAERHIGAPEGVWRAVIQLENFSSSSLFKNGSRSHFVSVTSPRLFEFPNHILELSHLILNNRNKD